MKIARMMQAINHQKPDRVPRGELLISSELIARLCPDSGLNDFERKKKVLERLTMDFVTVTPSQEPVLPEPDGNFLDVWGRRVTATNGYWVMVEPAIKDLDQIAAYRFPDHKHFELGELGKWLKDSDFFVFALLDGIFQGTASLLDFNEFLMATVAKKQELKVLAGHYGDFLYALASRCLRLGVHGLIIGDDMASSQGSLISPKALEEIFFPVYRRVLRDLAIYQAPVFLHCDGNINFLLPYLTELGFRGIHSLEPKAGMDLALVKERYGQELCLMGNVDPALLESGDLPELKMAVREVLRVGAPSGGFILSTASGSLTGGMSPESVLAMYLV